MTKCASPGPFDGVERERRIELRDHGGAFLRKHPITNNLGNRFQRDLNPKQRRDTRRASVTSAAVSGVIGSRAGTTRPMVCTASGSTIGMARMRVGQARAFRRASPASRSPSGRCAHARTAGSSNPIPASAATRRRRSRSSRSMMRRFCMSGVSRQSGTCATSAQVTRVAVAERRVGRRQQPIALVIERHRGDAAERLVVEIGDAGVDLEIFQQRRGSRSRCATRW